MHSLLRDVNDMGELRSEHPGNFTYWLCVFEAWVCGGSVCFGIVVLASHLWNIMEHAKAKPEEAPPLFLLLVCGGWLFCGMLSLLMVYVIRRNRKIPLLFAMYEKGLLIVYRNRTVRRVFWNDINEVNRHEKRFLFQSIPKFLGISVYFRDFEKPVAIVRIPAQIFHDGEKLCESICERK